MLQMADFVAFVLDGVYDLLLEITGMEGETKALYNTLVVSVTATTITLCVGAVIQAFN